MTSPFHGFEPHHFSVISADPPWTFLTRSDKGKGRSPEQHYSCLSIAEIKALPVAELAAPDAVLFLWTTDPHLKIALEVMDAWGFEYKTVGFTWAKLQASLGIAMDEPLAEMFGETPVTLSQLMGRIFFTGMGYYTRANPEMCLLGTRGRPQRAHKDVRQLIVAPRREHSRKPDEAYAGMRRLFAGPAIELFARTARSNWSCWGNDTAKFS